MENTDVKSTVMLAKDTISASLTECYVSIGNARYNLI